MSADVIVLPVVRVERAPGERLEPRDALVDIFAGRVSGEEIERFLGELHRRGLCIAVVGSGGGD